MSDAHSFWTDLVHAGEPRVLGAAIPPIFQSTVFESADADPSYDSIRYPRLHNTPNHEVLAQKLAALEGSDAAFVTSSGMAAITTVLLHLLRDGGHVLVQDCLYGGTHAFVHHQLAAFGASFDVLDEDPSRWAAQVRPNTRAIYVEAMSNPLLRVVDHRAVVEFARRHELVSVIDATFASPANFRAGRFGFDLVLHSATKYLNGHSDLCAGAVLGGHERIAGLRSFFHLLGGSLDALGCYLLHRGLRTLGMRVARQNETAGELARWLSAQPQVATVHYPGLQSHPDHALARELFCGAGGVLSFELRGADPSQAAQALIRGLRIVLHAPSLGGPETLITRPCRTSHAGLSAAERHALGIGDGLLRVSVGFEDFDDLRGDFAAALRCATA